MCWCKIWHLRVVILNHHGVLDFCVFICFVTGSKCMDAPFFLKGKYIEKVTLKNLFFPWRSTMTTYGPLQKGKSRKYPLFWSEGGFGGIVRTPGEKWPKCLEWTQWCFSKPLAHQFGLLSRNSFFKSQKFQKWPLFQLISSREFFQQKILFSASRAQISLLGHSRVGKPRLLSLTLSKDWLFEKIGDVVSHECSWTARTKSLLSSL